MENKTDCHLNQDGFCTCYQKECIEIGDCAPKLFEKLGINRVEIISKQDGREKVVKAHDIEFSLQDEGTTLKVFYGYKNK